MKRYDKYKPSGVEWMGEIPEHWEVRRLKHIAEIVLGKMLSTEDKEGGLFKPYLRAANIQWLKVDVSDIKEMWFSEKEIEKLRLKEGDLLVSEGGEVGRTCIWDGEIEECFIQNSVHKITFKNRFNSRFFLYQFLFLGSKGYFDSIVNRISIAHLTGEKIREISLYLPPFSEQTAIANYLDNKTAKIDNLIIGKQRLTELLKEERTAIINQAVTKGINPKVKLKPSGIEWLGDIPEHWEMKKLKWVGNSIQTGSTPPSNNQEYYVEEMNWFTPSDFRANLHLSNSKRKISLLALTNEVVKLFPANSMLIVGVGATLGKIGYILEPATSNQQIHAISFNNKTKTLFYSYFFHSNQKEVASYANTATLAILNQSQVKDIFLPFPPASEQTSIVEYIETHTHRIDETIAKIDKEIILLQEYRTALISEVVTGKVKVV